MHNKHLFFSQQTATYPKLNLQMLVPHFYPQAHFDLVGVRLFPLYLYVLQSCIFFTPLTFTLDRGKKVKAQRQQG